MLQNGGSEGRGHAPPPSLWHSGCNWLLRQQNLTGCLRQPVYFKII